MFKEEIKKLAAEQVAERKARQAKKASDEPRRWPTRPLNVDGTQKGYYGLTKEERRQYEEACKLVLPYHEWFIASQRRKLSRRHQIRIRHLYEMWMRGVPYLLVESKTVSDLKDLAYWMTELRLYVCPDTPDPWGDKDIRPWLGLPPVQNPYPRVMSPYTPRVLGLPAPQPEKQEASVA